MDQKTANEINNVVAFEMGRLMLDKIAAEVQLNQLSQQQQQQPAEKKPYRTPEEADETRAEGRDTKPKENNPEG